MAQTASLSFGKEENVIVGFKVTEFDSICSPFISFDNGGRDVYGGLLHTNHHLKILHCGLGGFNQLHKRYLAI